MENIIKDIESRFQVSDYVQQRPELAYATVKKELAIALITHLKDIEGFTHFVLLTAVDWLEENKFQLTYILNHPDKKVDLGIRVFIDRANPIMDSAHHLWEQVATYQRELKEMFGIDFPGSPRVDEDFILEGWDDIPPYRRDFDTLQYSRDTYFPREGRSTNDPAEHMKKKLYPDEEK
ncbi:NADH-quinone oxidoreductase subunit C [Salinivirga cyanobacteriivorans]|uniref:NADH-quinone oxidoreductase subunit C 1 n=1 Tax=Salinivirga cyanobacteriivorans TaxID=1307839 RepID=A0A0S2I2S1_9BACT|nr:NADH-quinone oxidoreductase subunit C [Salinivirga cyanobacteriivorans]ALO16332.1 NADH-quinone oxidoreductase subunit C 1 [Salinivirga cyanobacteriivorans]